MKPFNNLITPPFYTILYMSARKGMDAGLYSEALSTLASAASLRSSFLGFVSDTDSYEEPILVTYWTTHKSMGDWLNATRDLLPYRIKLEDCLGPSGCLWPWLNRLEETDIDMRIRAA